MSSMAATVLLVVSMYAGIGVIFAAFFVTAGVSRIDAEAEGASLGFRLLILPGTIALWPLLLSKTRSPARAEGEVGES